MTIDEAINMLYGIQADNLNLDDAYTKDKYDALSIAIEELEKKPEIGHWMRKTKVDGVYDIAGVKTWGVKCQCDKCDFTTTVIEDFGYYNYCPNCAAKMVEWPQKGGDQE